MAREFSVVVGINATRAAVGARQFQAASTRVTAGATKMAVSTNRANKSMLAFITTLGRVRGVATLAFAGFLGVGGLGAVVKTITQFTTALSKVEALLGPRGVGGAMVALEQRARSLGATTVFTATQAAEGMSFLTLAGFDALEVFEAIGPALTLAQAGTLGLGEAADIVSNIMAGFSIEAGRTGEVVDALAFVASRTNTNIRQLGEAMKFVAPVAGAVGISVQETAAALGILGNAGLQASLAGTSLRRVFSGLLNPSKEATQVLDGMGLVAGDLVAKIGKQGGLNEVIQILSQRGLGAAEAFTLFGQRGAPGILSLINQKDKLNDMNITMQNIVGTAKDMATIMTDNLGGDARLAISALQEGILQLGAAGLTEWLRATTQKFGGFIRGLTDVKINMFEATDAMRNGIAMGIKFKDNIDKVRQALFVLASFLLRNMIKSIGLFAAQLLVATAHTAGFTRAVLSLGVTANTTRTALIRMRAALFSTGLGIAVVAVGLLAAKLFEASEETKRLAKENERAENSFKTLSDEVAIAAFNFEEYTNAERRREVTKLTQLIRMQEDALRDLNLAAVAAQGSQLALPPAMDRLKEATEALNKVYGEGFDIQTIYAAAGSENALKLMEFRDAQIDVNNVISQFGDATEEQVLPSLERMSKELSISRERLEVWNLMIKTSGLGLKEATDIIQGNVDAREAFAIQLQKETGLMMEEFLVLQALITKFGVLKADTKDNANNFRIVATALSTLVKSGEGASATAEKLRVVLANLSKEMGADSAKAAEKLAKEFEKIEDRLNPLVALTRDFYTEALILSKVIGTDTPEAVARLREELIKLRGEYDTNIKKLEETCEKTDALEKCMSKSAKAMKVIWNQALRNIQDAFADAFRGAFDSATSFFDGILNAFKDMISQMLAQWAISGLAGLFTGKGFSGFGFGGGAKGAATTVGGSLLGSAGAVGATFIGAAKLFIEGVKAFVGFGAGGSAGAGAIFQAGGASAGAGALVAGGATGALTGGLVDGILGGRGDPGTTLGLSAIGGAIGSIWGPIGSVIGGAIGSFASNLFGGAKELESATLAFGATADGFNAVVESVVSKQKSFFRGRSFSTTTTDVDTASFDEALAGVIDRLGVTAEALGVDLEAALANFSFSREINIKGKSEAQIATLVENLFNEVLIGVVDEFINSAEGLSERLGRTVDVFRGNAEEFLRAFELAASIDLAFLVDPLTLVTETMETANQTLTSSYLELVAAYRVLLAEYDGSLASLEALAAATNVVVSAQVQLVSILTQVGQELSTLFGGSAQFIRDSLLSEEELYNVRSSRIDDLIAQAAVTTDPAELDRLGQLINSLGLDIFNSLDEDQQQAQGEEFAQFFDGLDTLFADQVSTGISTIVSEQAALDLEVATRMLEAADALIEAARLQREEVEARRDDRQDNRNEISR